MKGVSALNEQYLFWQRIGGKKYHYENDSVCYNQMRKNHESNLSFSLPGKEKYFNHSIVYAKIYIFSLNLSIIWK